MFPNAGMKGASDDRPEKQRPLPRRGVLHSEEEELFFVMTKRSSSKA